MEWDDGACRRGRTVPGRDGCRFRVPWGARVTTTILSLQANNLRLE